MLRTYIRIVAALAFLSFILIFTPFAYFIGFYNLVILMLSVCLILSSILFKKSNFATSESERRILKKEAVFFIIYSIAAIVIIGWIFYLDYWIIAAFLLTILLFIFSGTKFIKTQTEEKTSYRRIYRRIAGVLFIGFAVILIYVLFVLFRGF